MITGTFLFTTQHPGPVLSTIATHSSFLIDTLTEVTFVSVRKPTLKFSLAVFSLILLVSLSFPFENGKNGSSSRKVHSELLNFPYLINFDFRGTRPRPDENIRACSIRKVDLCKGRGPTLVGCSILC